jgi:hypothetical protein
VKKQEIWVTNPRMLGGPEMESAILTIKFAVFYGAEVFVVAVMAGAAIIGLVQTLQNQVHENHIGTSTKTSKI